MSIIGISHTEITGLAVSGTTDDLGSWNIGVDLAPYGVPVSATGAFIIIAHTSTSSRWAGLRDNTKSTPHVLGDYNGRYSYLQFVSVSNGLVDIYTEGLLKFFVVGYTDSDFVAFDIDTALPAQAHVSGIEQIVTADTSVPLSATVLVSRGAATFAPIQAGGALSRSSFSGSIHLVVLDESNGFYSSNSISTPLLGYDTSPATALAGDSVPIVADSSWRPVPTTYPNASMVFAMVEGGDDAAISQTLRASGSSYTDPSESGPAKSSTSDGVVVSAVGTNGGLEYFAETGAIAPKITIYGFSGALPPGPSIALSTDLQPGASFTLNYSNYDAIPVSPVTITDSNNNSITVPVTINDSVNGTTGKHEGTATGTMPALPSSGSIAGLKFGTVNVSLSSA